MSSTNEPKVASKASFERPSINPIIKIAKLKRNSLGSKLKDDFSYPGSLSGSEHGQEGASTAQTSKTVKASSNQQQNLNGRKLVPISLFPSYYVSKEATNYTKLINILFNSQDKNKSLNFDVKEELEKIKREQEEQYLKAQMAASKLPEKLNKASSNHYRYITSNVNPPPSIRPNGNQNARRGSMNAIEENTKETTSDDVDEYYYYYALNQSNHEPKESLQPIVVNTTVASTNTAKVTSIEPVDLTTLVAAEQGQTGTSGHSRPPQNSRVAKSSSMNSNDLVYRLSKKLNSRKVPSETPPKREQLSAKLSSNHFSNQNLSSLHVNQLNLDSSILANSLNSINNTGRLNFRNKSASSSSDSHNFHHHSHSNNQNSQFAQLQSIYQLNQGLNGNGTLNSNANAGSNTSINSLMTTNNALNLINPIMLNNQTGFNANVLSGKTSLTTRNISYLANNGATNRENGSNSNNSNKFLEDILTNNGNSKRSIKSGVPSSHMNNNTVFANATIGSQQMPTSFIVINRTNEERGLYPDKLILERRNLTTCPVIEGDEQLKLINYQHNFIRFIQNLDQMKSLIFLDLYDNRIERISGLSELVNLRVLMLGKNRIERIENLENLIYLDVLDLHGNQIKVLENLNNLRDLRVLNMAANQLKQVSNLHGLKSLIEFNLRRNQIEEISDIDSCTKLQRLFLSYNELMSLSSIKNLNMLTSLQDLCLDGNPIANEKNYKRDVLARVASLKKLDSKRVTDEEKRVAEKMYMREEYRKKEIEMLAFTEEKRRLTIQDAENEWLAQQKVHKDSHRKKSTVKDNDSISVNKAHSSSSESPSLNNASGHNEIIDLDIHTNRSRPNSSGPNTLSSTYHNYLQNYPNQKSSNPNGANTSQDNSKMKIVSLRNSLPNVNASSIIGTNVNGTSYYFEKASNSSISPPPQLPSLKSRNQGAMSALNSNNSMNSSSSSSINSSETSTTARDRLMPLSNAQTASSDTNETNARLNDEDINDFNSFMQRQVTTNTISRASSAAANLASLGALRSNQQQLSPIKTSLTSNALTANNANNNLQTPALQAAKRTIGFNGGSNILEDNIMYFYGNKSLEILDLKLEPNMVAQVTTISFHYIDYDDFLCKCFARIRAKFVNLNHLIFTCCNIYSLRQLDYLAEFKRLESIVISKEDNPIYDFYSWRFYLVGRLSSLQLKRINHQPIGLDDLKRSEQFLTPLTNMALQLPEYKLVSVLGPEKRKTIKAAKEKLNDPNSSSLTIEQSLARETVAKSVLAANNQAAQTIKQNSTSSLSTLSNSDSNKLAISRNLLNSIYSEMNYNDLKKQKIKNSKDQLWSQFVTSCVEEKLDPEAHVKELCQKHKINLF